MKKTVFALIFMLAISGVHAEEMFPKPDWKDAPDPLASPYATPGGEISIFAGPYPGSLNYYLDNNTFTVEVFSAMFETLLTMNPVTLEFEPGIAEKWSISDDKKTFTFYIDKRAKWSDGTPITARDVKWTFDAIMDPKNLTGPHKVYLGRFDSPEIIDDATIRFHAKDVHWENLNAAGGFHILCQKAYQDKDFNTINFEFPVVSGPYKIGEISEGIYITIERRDDWWGRVKKSTQGTGNFQTLRFRVYAERENAFEAFKKGMIDLYPIYTARIWVNETQGDKFFKNWIVKQKIFNHNPVGFQGFAMNMRKPPFDDVRVRKAMAYLLDREKMNSTLMYNQYFLHRSFFEDLYDKDHPCPNELITMDKEKARALLKEAGWTVNPKTGFLEKNGKRFTIRFLTRSSTSDMFLAIYAEDLKDVGIELVIDKKDWAAWAKDMESFNFEMTWAAWSSGIFKNPESMWHSREAESKGGNNICGYKNEKVDELIEKQKTIFDVEKRNDIYREIDQLIYQEWPYVLLWNINYTRLLYWNKFGMPDTVLSKYGDERSAYWYWWVDMDSKAELDDAMKNDLGLPPKEPTVYFDQIF